MKTCTPTAQRDLSAPADVVWATIARMDGMEDWYPGLISASRIETTADGIARHCTMADGNALHERILTADSATRTFVYALDRHPFPARHVVGSIRVDDLGPGCRVTWSAQFQAEDDIADAFSDQVAAIYAAGLESLDAYQTEREGEAA